MQRENVRIVQLYKLEIYDWCGHDLACQLVAEKTGLPERIVRNIVDKAGSIFS
jgi:hypothetical protein